MDSTRRQRMVPSYLEPTYQEYKECHLPKTDVVRRIDFDGISEDDTIRVFLRIKPLRADNVTDEINNKHYKLNDGTFTSIMSNGKAEIQNEYFFNGILSPSASQTEVFDLVVRPRLEEVLLGNDTLLFSYGTTGSGKTFTIQGKGSEPGIIPRVLYVIFASIDNCHDTYNYLCPYQSTGVTVLSDAMVNEMEKEKESILENSENIMLKIASKSARGNDTIRAVSYTEMEGTLKDVEPIPIDKDLQCLYSVWLSFIEVYNETIYDLFINHTKKVPLKLAIDENKTSYFKGVKYICVSSWEEAYQLYLYGKHNLHVSPTIQNKNSSRSHCILTIKIIKRPVQNDGSYYCVSSSCLGAYFSQYMSWSDHSQSANSIVGFTICDLAGAERQKKTRNCGARLKESQSINTSLLVLNRCFNIIRANQTHKEQDYQMVPFRESKLTLLFQHALLGNAGITMITNISQSDELTSETYQVLKSTAVAMKIKAKPFVKKTFKKRKSIFADYCSTRIEEEPVTTSCEIDEGVGSSLGCNNCFEYKKEIDKLQQSLNQKDTILYEIQENSKKREEEIRLECYYHSSKILGENYKDTSSKIEAIKEEHRKEIQELKKSYREYYEKKQRKRLSPIYFNEQSQQSSGSFQMQKLNDFKVKLLKVSELFGIKNCKDGEVEPNEMEMLDEIIDAQKRAEHKIMRQTEEIDTLKANLTRLHLKIISTAGFCGLDSISQVDDKPINHEDILDRLTEFCNKSKTDLAECDKNLAIGLKEFKELEDYSRTLVAKINNLEEEIAIKDHKIEELTSDVDNLSALLASKTKELESQEQVEADAIVALGKLTLEDGSEQPIYCDKVVSAKKLRRRRTTRRAKLSKSDGNSDSELDDPTFFLPVHAATTGKKKKNRTRRPKLELPSYSRQATSEDETLNLTRTRRKLFRIEADHFGDDIVPVELKNSADVCQQSPESFMKTLRPRKI